MTINIKSNLGNISLTIATVCIAIELSALLSFNIFKKITLLEYIIPFFKPHIDLVFFNSRLFTYYNFDSNMELSYINLSFYIILLIATLSYINSKGNKIRLLRFCYSIFLFYNVLVSFLVVIWPLLFTSMFREETIVIWKWAYFNIFPFWWAFVSYYILKILAKERKIKVLENNYVEHFGPDYSISTKEKRVIHLILDIFIGILVFSNLLFYLNQGFDKLGIFTIKSDHAPYIYAILIQCVYCTFYEVLLGSTPAKFLTETKVIAEDGSKLDFRKGMLRSLIRLIPFEPFSFLFNDEGWHDKWSDTLVVDEEKVIN